MTPEPDRPSGEAVGIPRPSDAIFRELPELINIRSMHRHIYDTGITVACHLAQAREVGIDLRTPEQQQLLNDVKLLAKYTRGRRYQDVYTPDELHFVVEELEKIPRAVNDRPTFLGLEIDIIQTALPHKIGKAADSLRAFLRRAQEGDTDSRRGMQWRSLRDLAGEAVGRLREKQQVLHGNRFSEEMRSYYLKVRDPEPGKLRKGLDLTHLYQFQADQAAGKILGRRSAAVQSARKEAFVGNCRAINVWHGRHREIINEVTRGDTDMNRLRFQIDDLIFCMNIRWCGPEACEVDPRSLDMRSGRYKDWESDVAGAFRLQKRIMHTIEELRGLIDAGTEPVRGERIVPLD